MSKGNGRAEHPKINYSPFAKQRSRRHNGHAGKDWGTGRKPSDPSKDSHSGDIVPAVGIIIAILFIIFCACTLDFGC